MIEIIAIAALATVGGYATLKGAFGAAAQVYAKAKEASVKAELTKLKADAKAEITKLEAAGSADLKTAIADLKKLF